MSWRSLSASDMWPITSTRHYNIRLFQLHVSDKIKLNWKPSFSMKQQKWTTHSCNNFDVWYHFLRLRSKRSDWERQLWRHFDTDLWTWTVIYRLEWLPIHQRSERGCKRPSGPAPFPPSPASYPGALNNYNTWSIQGRRRAKGLLGRMRTLPII